MDRLLLLNFFQQSATPLKVRLVDAGGSDS
jgi:hypothetical protein